MSSPHGPASLVFNRKKRSQLKLIVRSAARVNFAGDAAGLSAICSSVWSEECLQPLSTG